MKTRGNSARNMLAALVDYERAVNNSFRNYDPRAVASEFLALGANAIEDDEDDILTLDADSLANCAPDSATWWLCKLLLQVFKPFKEVTLLAEKEKSLPIQQGIPLYRLLLHKLHNVANPIVSSCCTRLAENQAVHGSRNRRSLRVNTIGPYIKALVFVSTRRQPRGSENTCPRRLATISRQRSSLSKTFTRVRKHSHTRHLRIYACRSTVARQAV